MATINCIKAPGCELRQLINIQRLGVGLTLDLPARFIANCSADPVGRCQEINGLAVTGFDDARRVVLRSINKEDGA